MPHFLFQKRSSFIQLLFSAIVLFISLSVKSQIKWSGNAGDGQWTTAANWVGNILPGHNDDVVLDNSNAGGSYSVSLPASTVSVIVRTISISPGPANNIQLIIPASNTAATAFTATGPGYGIVINNGGLFLNSSGAASGNSISVSDSIQINNGGQYTHNTRTTHAAIVAVLSKKAGTENGIFKFDVPGGGYTVSSSNRTYGTLIFSSNASAGSQIYTSTAASPLVINGNLIIEAGVTINLNVTAATTINGSYNQQGGVFNLANQPNNNIINIKGDLIQTAGTITETSTGFPVIELNGTVNQNIQIAGSVSGNIGFRINNSAGVTLLSNLSLPYNLSLKNGIVNSNSFLTTLLTGCSITADSTTNVSFINGALRKEGLSSSSTFLFPVGKGNLQRWLSLKNVTGNYTVEYFKLNPGGIGTMLGTGIHHISSIEYWAVDADAAPVSSAAIELSFNNVNSGGVTDVTSLRVAQFSSSVWTNQSNAATTGTAGSVGSVISNLINVFGTNSRYFTLASSDDAQNPLPLKLISFSGFANSIANIINWQIANGWKPAYFQLESCTDNLHFNIISKIDTLNDHLNYQYTDKRMLIGKQYYRLKIFAPDGSFSYSNTIEITKNENVLNTVLLRPTIIKSNAQLFINSVTNTTVQLSVFDADGRLRNSEKISLQTGANIIPLQFQLLANGTYILKINTVNGSSNICRFIKIE